jgi:alpha-D-ribose 1-methylphosphonate 5-phosphate C-P lyase
MQTDKPLETQTEREERKKREEPFHLVSRTRPCHICGRILSYLVENTPEELKQDKITRICHTCYTKRRKKQKAEDAARLAQEAKQSQAEDQVGTAAAPHVIV